MIAVPWNSSSGAANAAALRAKFSDAFLAISEIDRLGHLLLNRVGSDDETRGVDWLVGVGLLRRSVATFAGFRALVEASSIDPSKALARAHFELWLHYRTFAYGSERKILPSTPLEMSGRELRAHRYYVYAQRRALRSRALVAAPGSKYRAKDVADRDKLEKELQQEIERLRVNFPNEWNYFGDVTALKLIDTAATHSDKPWFAGSFEPEKVDSVKDLAYAFDAHWEYDFVYDLLSTQLHPRGISSDLSFGDDYVEIHHPHNAEWFPMVAFWTSSWHLLLLMAAARLYAPVVDADLRRFDLEHGPALRALPMDADVWRLG